MAAGDIARIIHAPGRLVVNPTTEFATTAFPYGGTQVGKSNLCFVRSLGTPFAVEYESLGEVGDVLEGNNRYVFTCFLRGWDDDAVEIFLSGGFEAGATTQHAVFHSPGTKTPGESALDRCLSWVYVPDDIIHSDGVLIYNGIPDWDDGAELAFQRGTELGIPLRVECLRDDNDNTIRIGRIQDLTLT